MEKQAKLTEPLGTLPIEYWEIDASIYGALADDLSADGLVMSSIRDMPVGARLNVRIFYAKEYELDSITVAANTVSKDHNIAEDWKGYRYQLRFVQIPERDRLKLKDLLNDHPEPEYPGREDRKTDNSSLRELVLPPLPDSDLSTLPPSHCKSYENGKCLKTHAFCDLCQTADHIMLSEMASSAKKSRSRGSRPFSSTLAKLARNVKSAFRGL